MSTLALIACIVLFIVAAFSLMFALSCGINLAWKDCLAAIGVHVLAVSLLLAIASWRHRTCEERMHDLISVVEKGVNRSEQDACRVAGLSNPEWDPKNETRFTCADARGLVHEVRAPKCNSREFARARYTCDLGDEELNKLYRECSLGYTDTWP